MVSNLFKTTYKKHEFQQIFKEQKPIFRRLNLKLLHKNYHITQRMALSWNEIKDRAVAFSKEWEGTFSEDSDAKPFLVEFFNVFGLNQRKDAAFEHKVKKLGDNDGYIDMLWKNKFSKADLE
jgi:hypothetical protein